MAEIQQKGGDSGKGGKKRAKKASTKIDMTPMVDLAFLLLTFFMLTTTFAKPNVMQLTMPVKEKNPNPEEQTKIKASQAVTIILGADDKVYYYFGLNNPKDPSVAKPELKVTDYSQNGIRKVLLARQQQQPEPIILIKPYEYEGKEARYKNMVDILDEMNITNQKKYALVDISKDDIDLITASGL
ncbi:biopolymer transporter ExbD [Hymenobacter sp. ASUV-10]|uniref:Biopolymer transporter ExbD n=1 Tax=Hymenobacter aranciens TaxID=3063996 RepID=A0ABT9B9R2_9BACT|nr:biopolymer transporter ExbD [Hymenobacter sp. ASUV-10]MDO7875000.1 biopolymer transporter ExbD [Hymenobacter sp. ASUV-10]